MLQLPYEILQQIIIGIPDKMNISMTNKNFDKLLTQMYNDGKLTYRDDPYFLKRCYKKDDILYGDKNISEIMSEIKDLIPHLHNHNSLNYIFTIFFVEHKFGNKRSHFDQELQETYYNGVYNYILYKLLLQNCMMNNVSKPKYIKLLSSYITETREYSELISSAFLNKSHGILMILFSDIIARESFIRSIVSRYKYETNIEVITKEIEFLDNNYLISLVDVYAKIYDIASHDLLLKDKVLLYLEHFVNKVVVDSMIGWL
jgi:hypothetical protein